MTYSIIGREPTYGPLALTLLHHGRSPEEALAELTAADSRRDLPPVAAIGARGGVAGPLSKEAERLADALGRADPSS